MINWNLREVSVAFKPLTQLTSFKFRISPQKLHSQEKTFAKYLHVFAWRETVRGKPCPVCNFFCLLPVSQTVAQPYTTHNVSVSSLSAHPVCWESEWEKSERSGRVEGRVYQSAVTHGGKTLARVPRRLRGKTFQMI